MNHRLLLVGLNTRHTHTHLSLASLEAWWTRLPGRPPLTRLDLDMNRGYDSLLAELLLHRPTVAAFAAYIWSLPLAVSLSGALAAAFPGLRIIFGGPEASFSAAPLLQAHPWIEAVVRGEGEATFEELLTRILEDSPLAGIPGLTFRTAEGLRQEPDRPLLAPLDSIPSPFQLGLFGRGQGFTYYESTRGCPFRCAYCLSSVLGPLRSFSLDRVKSDLDWFFQSDFTQIRFADRTFNQDPERAATIIEHILRGNSRQKGFHFELKADTIGEPLIDLLAQAPEGMFHLEIGVQSTHMPTLQAVNRVSDLERLTETVRRLRERTRCHIHLDLLAGLPREDLPTFRRSLDDAFRMRPTTIQVGLVKILKGTALEGSVQRGELACAPTPPYAVVRSAWLGPEEIVLIQDIGKLVEGLHNPGRFASSLGFLIRRAFAGSPARFFERLAGFWRASGRLFHSFGPEGVTQALLEFARGLTLPALIQTGFEALLQHDFRLTQKVPSGRSGPVPAFPRPAAPPQWKLAPGLRIFWYPLDILPLLATEDVTEPGMEEAPAPVVYGYETDLSKVPRTRWLDLPLVERLVLAFVEKDVPPERFAEAAGLVPGRSFSPEVWPKALDGAREKGFVWSVNHPRPSRGS